MNFLQVCLYCPKRDIASSESQALMPYTNESQALMPSSNAAPYGTTCALTQVVPMKQNPSIGSKQQISTVSPNSFSNVFFDLLIIQSRAKRERTNLIFPDDPLRNQQQILSF
ncbi:hypothetical protein NPIL_316621 [Nephila pilipes]|uniref:Uncharacterized protein n=1 Tax=Nephila pilipes TaxID=299642 RepID=A0A8X6UFD9_NEPPI|nr:hypothetical protein NPIL_316621 [Nephila pilipes]